MRLYTLNMNLKEENHKNFKRPWLFAEAEIQRSEDFYDTHKSKVFASLTSFTNIAVSVYVLYEYEDIEEMKFANQLNLSASIIQLVMLLLRNYFPNCPRYGW